MPKHALRILPLIALLLLMLSFAVADSYTTLFEGDGGAAVHALKERLYDLGYFKTTKFSKVYNETTAERVREFQKLNGLEVTGIADPAMQELLYSDTCLAANGMTAEEYLYLASLTPTPKPTKTPKPTRDPNATKTPKPTKTPKVDVSPRPVITPSLEPETPERDENGFLKDETEEFVFIDADDGQWIYLSSTLQVQIRRMEDPSYPLVWYETDVRTQSEERLHTARIEKIASGKMLRSQVLARRVHAVLAISDDHYVFRVRNKTSPGVIIRDGKILYDKAKLKANSGFPKQEVLAYFQDGSMKCFDNGEHTAQEYLEMGATDVFSFGPILVTNGEPGPDMLKPKYYHYKEPRSAIGMIEPGHYVILTVKGRVKESAGCYFPFLAGRMIELGVQEALNLDGGGTTSLVFMGEQLNYKGTASRSVASIITFGTSDLVPAE